MAQEGGRRYAGRSDAERRAGRRARLMEAGLDLFGTDGWGPTSIERLCAHASVATRSFYQEFSGREPLLQAVYDAVVSDAGQALTEALQTARGDLPARLAAGMAAYVRHVTDDVRRARVVHREARVVGALQAHRAATIAGFAALLESSLDASLADGDPARRRVLALALSGAVSEVLADWVDGAEPRPPLEAVVQELTRLYVTALTPVAPDA